MSDITVTTPYVTADNPAIVGRAIVGVAVVGQIYKPSEITIGTAEDEAIIVRSVNKWH